MALCAKRVDLTGRTRVYRHNPVQYVRRTPGLVGLSMVIARHLGSDCKPGRPSPSREQDETAQASANYNVYRIRLRAPVPDIGDAIAQHSYAAAIYSPGPSGRRRALRIRGQHPALVPSSINVYSKQART
jgi:hypothetical protein